tara:strand:+ start:4567 stop:5787 length:1221 start_codon:yes stop_codon:yes gene_type:complete
MAIQVVFAFSQDAGGVTNFFELDGAVKGKLDNTVYTLGGDFSLVDVTTSVRTLNITRGRSALLGEVQAGSASIVLDNRARLFDPLSGTGGSFPYVDNIVPRKNVQILLDGVPIFSGLVDDWQIDYAVSGDSTTTAVCGDGFLTLGQTNVSTTTKSAQTSGARIGTVLTESGWPTGKRDLDTGLVTLQTDTPAANTNLLSYISRIKNTEFGAFYMDRQGLATFEDRQATQNFATATVLGTGGVPISSIEVDSSTDQIFNTVKLTRNGGGTETRTDSTSETTYGKSELSKTDLLFDDDTELGELADFLLARHKDVAYEITSVSIIVDGLSTAQRATVGALEVADPLQVVFSPSVGAQISQFATLDRVEHSFTRAEPNHVVTLSMSQAQPSFILDSATFGKLDTSTLGF